MPLLHRSYSNSRYRGGRVTSHPTAYPLTGSRYITGMPYDVFGAMKAKCLPIGMEFERSLLAAHGAVSHDDSRHHHPVYVRVFALSTLGVCKVRASSLSTFPLHICCFPSMIRLGRAVIRYGV